LKIRFAVAAAALSALTACGAVSASGGSAVSDMPAVRLIVEESDYARYGILEIAEEEMSAYYSEDADYSDYSYEDVLAREERNAGYLLGYADEADALAEELDGLSSDMSAGGGRDEFYADQAKFLTVTAARDYLGMLSDSARDFSFVLTYDAGLYKALTPMFDWFDSEEGVSDDYYLYASSASEAIAETLRLLGELEPPQALHLAHADVKLRVDEFRVLFEDFAYAVEIDDPLRIYSCRYRLDRLATDFDEASDELYNDMYIQLDRVLERMYGQIDTLRYELEVNMDAIITGTDAPPELLAGVEL
jgi:hypothetical protein